MLGLREGLAKIGITGGCSYPNDFISHPASLNQAISAMSAPSEWQQVSDMFRDDHWTDEVQGVAWDGTNWIFSSNANQKKPSVNDKSIYVFEGGKPLADGKWKSRIAYKDIPHPIAGSHESDDHWGPPVCANGLVYVSHVWHGGPKQGQSSVVVFNNDNGILSYSGRWIELGVATSSNSQSGYPEFQAINPWDGKWYSCFWGADIPEFFIHNPEDGEWERRVLSFPEGSRPSFVQGACFSPNGHLYVAVDRRFDEWDKKYKWIFYYSALNGAFMGKIPVLAEDLSRVDDSDVQELEGICYGAVSVGNAREAQIHAILLENRRAALDNMFFKSFCADAPEIV